MFLCSSTIFPFYPMRFIVLLLIVLFLPACTITIPEEESKQPEPVSDEPAEDYVAAGDVASKYMDVQ